MVRTRKPKMILLEQIKNSLELKFVCTNYPYTQTKVLLIKMKIAGFVQISRVGSTEDLHLQLLKWCLIPRRTSAKILGVIATEKFRSNSAK